MPLEFSPDAPISISIGIYKPQPLFTTNCVLEHLCKISKYFESTGCVRSAFLKSANNDDVRGWVAVFSVWETGSHAQTALCQLPTVDVVYRAISVVAEVVEQNWYEFSFGRCKEGITDKWSLSKGDVVNLRDIFVKPESQEVFSYSCLAVANAYVHKINGLQKCTFYKSLDGTKIVGLGLWDTREAANAFRHLGLAAPYWEQLGERRSRHRVCKVVYISGE